MFVRRWISQLMGPALLLSSLNISCGKIWGTLNSTDNGNSSSPPQNNNLSLTSGNLNFNSQVTLTASGGTPPYTYSLVSGTGTLNTSTGDYFSPSWSTSVTVQVTDSAAQTSQASFNVDGDRMWNIDGFDGTNSHNGVYTSINGSTWTPIVSNLPAISSHGCLVYKNQLWILGGFNGSYSSAVYSSSDGITWTHVGDLPAARADGAVAVFNGLMWFAGGTVDALSGQQNLWSSSDGITWTVNPMLPQPLYGSTMINYNNALYLMGGITNNGNNYRKWVFKTTDGTSWNVIGNLPADTSFGGAVVYNNLIWFFGGLNGSGTMTTWNSSDGNNWNNLGSLISATWSNVGLVFGGQIYSVGGSVTDVGKTANGTWTLVGTVSNNWREAAGAVYTPH